MSTQSLNEEIRSVIRWGGRLSQPRFIKLFLLNAACFIVAALLPQYLASSLQQDGDTSILVITISSVAFVLLAGSVIYNYLLISQRLRDCNFHPLLVNIFALTPVSWIVILWYCFFREGSKSPNRYGDAEVDSTTESSTS